MLTVVRVLFAQRISKASLGRRAWRWSNAGICCDGIATVRKTCRAAECSCTGGFASPSRSGRGEKRLVHCSAGPEVTHYTHTAMILLPPLGVS